MTTVISGSPAKSHDYDYTGTVISGSPAKSHATSMTMTVVI